MRDSRSTAAAATAWHSDWYTTAEFGNLESGTGLLIDMGLRVTVTAAQITLGGLPGASLQLRAGNVPALAHLGEVASASGASGSVRMPLARPVRARYVLIWFTRLPPDISGTYQASVAEIALQGHALTLRRECLCSGAAARAGGRSIGYPGQVKPGSPVNASRPPWPSWLFLPLC